MPENSAGDCPCGSGLMYERCCGIPGRTAVNADIAVSVPVKPEDAHKPSVAVQSAIVDFAANPDLFTVRIDFAHGRAYLVKMSPDWYRDSVFLDPGRIKGTYVVQSDLAWLTQACANLHRPPSAYIFHTAFCGSTLMSQVLDCLYETVPVREPEILNTCLHYQRTLTNSEQYKTYWLGLITGLLARRYHDRQVAVVKANDFANPLMLEWIARRTQVALSPMLFMYTPVEEFVVACLKSQSRQAWITQRFHGTIAFARQALGLAADFDLPEQALGEMAAVYWSYNIALFYRAWRKQPDLLRSLACSSLLDNPHASIEKCSAYFGLHKRARRDDRPPLLGQLFSVYSKNSQLPYSPQQRRDDIDRQRRSQARACRNALALAMELLGEDYPQIRLAGDLLQ